MYFYSEYVLVIFDTQFIVADNTLGILLLSFPILVFSDIVYYLFYARGNYNYIFYIGLITNVPRVLFYFVLIPDFGNVGAAWAFTIGSFFQIIVTLVIVRKAKIKLQYMHYIGLTLIPFLIGYLTLQINIGILGAIVIFVASYLLFLKLKLFDEEDMENYLSVFSSNEQMNKRKTKIINILKYCKLY
jgi:O-antigen/teichoic acid export membrane protein